MSFCTRSRLMSGRLWQTALADHCINKPLKNLCWSYWRLIWSRKSFDMYHWALGRSESFILNCLKIKVAPYPIIVSLDTWKPKDERERGGGGGVEMSSRQPNLSKYLCWCITARISMLDLIFILFEGQDQVQEVFAICSRDCKNIFGHVSGCKSWNTGSSTFLDSPSTMQRLWLPLTLNFRYPWHWMARLTMKDQQKFNRLNFKSLTS